MSIKIEKGVTPPLGHTNRSELSIEMDKMEIGDSFVIELYLQTRISKVGIMLGKKFTTRRTSETEVRVWRIA